MGFEDILTYWSVIRKRWWVIFLLVAATIGTIIGTSFMSPLMYQASVKFRVNAPPPADVSLFQAGRYDLAEDITNTLNTFIDVLTGETVAKQVIDELELAMEPEDLQALTTIESVEIKGSDSNQEDSGLMKVSVTHPDPEQAAAIINKMIEISLEDYGEMRARSKTESREFIVSQLEATNQTLVQAQDKLIAFQIENTIGDLSQAIALQQGLIYDLRKQRDLAQAQNRLAEVASFNQLILDREVELQNLVRLEADYASLESSVEQSKETYKFLEEKYTEATLKENEVRTLGFLQMGGPVSPPSRPLPRVSTSIISLAGVVSFVLGIVIVFLWNYLELGQTRRAQKRVESGSLPTTSSAS